MSTVLTPYYRIYIKGKELDEFRYSMVKQVVFEDNASGSDLLTIYVEDPDFIFLNDDIFIEDAKVKFIGGFKDNYRTMFEGFISVIDAEFPSTGCPSLTIHCMDNTHTMNRVKKKRTWTNKRRSDVAKAIFKEYGLKTVIHNSPRTEESIAQSNQTDIDFLEKLADEELDPYLVYVEGNTGYYVKKEILKKQQATLDYRDGLMNVISFSPRINKETKQIEVQKSNVNTKDKKVDKAEANDNTKRDSSGTSPKTVDKNDGSTSWKSNSSNNNKKWTYTGGGSWVNKK